MDFISSNTLLEEIAATAYYDDIEDLIQKFKPDLSKHKNFVNILAAREPLPVYLINELMKSGVSIADLSTTTLGRLLDDPINNPLILDRVKTLGKNKITQSFYNLLQDNNFYVMNKWDDLFISLKSDIDINYRPEPDKPSLLELYMIKVARFFLSENFITEFLSKEIIDFSRHKKLLAIISDHDISSIFSMVVEKRNYLDETEDFHFSYNLIHSQNSVFDFLDKLTPAKLIRILAYNFNFNNFHFNNLSPFIKELFIRYNKIIDFNFPVNYSKDRTIPFIEHLFSNLIHSDLNDILDLINTNKIDVSKINNITQIAANSLNSRIVKEVILAITHQKADRHIITSDDIVQMNRFHDAQKCADLFTNWSANDLLAWIKKNP